MVLCIKVNIFSHTVSCSCSYFLFHYIINKYLCMADVADSRHSTLSKERIHQQKGYGLRETYKMGLRKREIENFFSWSLKERILWPAGLRSQFTHKENISASAWHGLTPLVIKMSLVITLAGISCSPSTFEVNIWLVPEISSEGEKSLTLPSL